MPVKLPHFGREDGTRVICIHGAKTLLGAIDVIDDRRGARSSQTAAIGSAVATRRKEWNGRILHAGLRPAQI